MIHVRNAIIIVNLNNADASLLADDIRNELEKRGVQTTVFAFEGRPDSSPQGKWDIAFSLGGDGTVLCTARMLASSGIPILPIHLGTFGFLAAVEKHNWLTIFEQWINQTVRFSPRCMLDLFVERDQTVYKNTCLNDIVISSSGIAKLIRLEIMTEVLPGEFAMLGSYRSDGLIIATPTGSTAYSVAAGGPILDPEMEALIINPICPFTLSNRPYVIPSRQPLLVTVGQKQRSGVLLTVDGQDTFPLEPGDRIVIRNAPHYAKLITPGPLTYYSALRTKLAWAEEPKNA